MLPTKCDFYFTRMREVTNGIAKGQVLDCKSLAFATQNLPFCKPEVALL